MFLRSPFHKHVESLLWASSGLVWCHSTKSALSTTIFDSVQKEVL